MTIFDLPRKWRVDIKIVMLAAVFCGYGIYESFSKNLAGIHLAKIWGGIWNKFLPFVKIIHDVGSLNLTWLLPWIIWTCMPKITSLAFFIWAEFVHFYTFLKILSVNYGRTKKARDTKFCTHISMELTYIYGKNQVPGILHLAYFPILLEKAKIEILINYYQIKRIRNMIFGKRIFWGYI